MTERLKVPVLKTGEGESPPWVRIPPHPPFNYINHCFLYIFFSQDKKDTQKDTPRLVVDTFD